MNQGATMNSTEDELRDRMWDELYRKIVALLRKYGKEEPTGDGDYWVVDDNYGWRRHTVNIFTLKMLDPEIVAALRHLLRGLSDWEIVVALDIPGKENLWPPMGVTIRDHEIIDGLRREFLPEPYRRLVIQGGRPGTGYD
jgi:hypothetical protein